MTHFDDRRFKDAEAAVGSTPVEIPVTMSGARCPAVAAAIHPVILCGGAGTRLWPLSRQDRPKQFAALLGQDTLLQACLKRFLGRGFAAPVLMAHEDFRFFAAEQAAAAGVSDPTILLEPSSRNTAAAILSAALHLERQGKGAEVMLVAPCDHVIRDMDRFHTALSVGAPLAAAGQLVTFGIFPDRPETGYGYLDLGDAPTSAMGSGAARRVRRFIEKPDAATAERLLASGTSLWNAGIFMFRADALIRAFRTHAPAMVDPCRRAVAQAQPDLGFLRLDGVAYDPLPEQSIDYAIMEKSADVVAVPVDCGWSDLGAWDAVWREMGPDAAGVAVSGDVTAMDCRDTLLRSEEDGLQLVGMGLEGVAVVAMRDAVLVADKSNLQALKTAVARLKIEGVRAAEAQARTHRPWGWYETLAMADRFQVKQIMVPPGRKLSLQSHVHRAEHWIVVQGTAQVTIADEVTLVGENQSVYIPLGERHRLENPGKVDLHLIEVQTGSYLGEDDIIRYEDSYNRL